MEIVFLINLFGILLINIETMKNKMNLLSVILVLDNWIKKGNDICIASTPKRLLLSLLKDRIENGWAGQTIDLT